MNPFNRFGLVSLLHFMCVYFTTSTLTSVIPTHLWDFLTTFSYLVVCTIISYYTFEFTKKKFLNEQINPGGKAVFITGCDTGFGHDLAKSLDHMGFHVYASCLYKSGPGAEKLKETCSERLQVLAMDVSNDESVKEAFNFVKQNLGSLELWALVNNAGIQQGFTIDFATIQDFKATMEVNCFGTARVTKTFLPLLRQYRGRIINLTSSEGRIHVPHNAPYVMSKFAAAGFSDCLRLEMSEWDIPVIQVEPELYRTPMTDIKVVKSRRKLENDSIPQELRNEYGEEYFHKLEIATERFLKTMCSPKTRRVLSDLEAAVCSKYPAVVYKPCRNYFMSLVFYTFELAPYTLQDKFVNFVTWCLGFPKPAKTVD